MSGKAAIVTGSTSGIGEAIAVKLASQGIRVLVTGRDAERGAKVASAIAGSGGEARFLQADLADPDTPERLVAEALDAWGRIDIVVNNAAMVCNKPTAEVTHRDWDRLFAVNVKSGFFLIQAALPHLKAAGGSVVNISSINGIANDYNNLVYDTMKAALNHMTRGLALDLLKEGVRFNALMPAGVATPLLTSWFREKLGDEQAAKQAAQEIFHAPDVGRPEQIADAAAFLVSSAASWINGAVIPIDGGFRIHS
ncbi:SDR family NAD(P)-dependent oxidoreductase [Paenibacillus sacheonensis]|uniref:Glucose 1-dehydrogenase n=1 Tax=Paenibacillus sacheonensis TaxID=742054 RepID=A0A7X4YJD1_9BACL|nr:glucose 1-dehydrogenase [Paenibacillus sacheonensis]MBM7564198.1 3-oxoacyl-[acyl-carrier protein] reductase [Paenibacillus sacheonensis]NBC67477.1 glucose 1-dehydrogenase [Paenibacillus sacheonensis]